MTPSRLPLVRSYFLISVFIPSGYTINVHAYVHCSDWLVSAHGWVWDLRFRELFISWKRLKAVPRYQSPTPTGPRTNGCCCSCGINENFHNDGANLLPQSTFVLYYKNRLWTKSCRNKQKNREGKKTEKLSVSCKTQEVWATFSLVIPGMVTGSAFSTQGQNHTQQLYNQSGAENNHFSVSLVHLSQRSCRILNSVRRIRLTSSHRLCVSTWERLRLLFKSTRMSA